MYLQLFNCLFRSIYFLLFTYTEEQLDEHIIYCCESLRNVNILYIKIFQAISMNTSITSQTISNYLMTFNDNVPFKQDDIDMHKLKYNLQIHNIDLVTERPVASGSIAYVFKGIFNDKYVAIKVKRNDIEKTLQNSIDDLRFLFRLLNIIPSFSRTNALTTLESNIDYLFEQCNFVNEWENIQYIYQRNKTNNKFIVPQPHCNDLVHLHEIIVMDWVDGVNINELNNEDKHNVFNLLVGYGIKSMFFDGYVHGDLHQGNCKYGTNGTLVIYDFGMICKLTNTEVDAIYKFCQLLFTGDVNNCVRFMLSNGLTHKDGQPILYPSTFATSELTTWFTKIIDRVPLNIIYPDINVFTNILSKYELISVNWFNKILLSMAINESLTTSLQTDTTYFECAKKYIIK